MLHCNPLKGGAGDWFGDNKVGWWAGTVKSPLHKVWSSLCWSLILSTCADRRRRLLVCLDVAQQLVCSYFNSYWCDLTTPTQIFYLHLKELQVWHMLWWMQKKWVLPCSHWARSISSVEKVWWFCSQLSFVRSELSTETCFSPRAADFNLTLRWFMRLKCCN